MAWLYLLCGGFFEIGWVGLLKVHGLHVSRPFLSGLTILLMLVSPLFLNLALKTLPINIGYAAFVGINAVMVLIGSFVIFRETLSLPQFLCVAMIVGGVVGLRLLEG